MISTVYGAIGGWAEELAAEDSRDVDRALEASGRTVSDASGGSIAELVPCRASQRPPRSTKFDQRVLLRRDGADVARVGDEQVGALQSIQSRVVLEDAGAHLFPLRERVEQLEPRVVEVVPLPAAHQDGVQPTGGPGHLVP